MAKIKTYKNEGPGGTYSQLDLEDGDSILISISQENVKIYKVWFLGIPVSTIWESKDLAEAYKYFMDGSFKPFRLLDSIIGSLSGCVSVEEVRQKIKSLPR